MSEELESRSVDSTERYSGAEGVALLETEVKSALERVSVLRQNDALAAMKEMLGWVHRLKEIRHAASKHRVTDLVSCLDWSKQEYRRVDELIARLVRTASELEIGEGSDWRRQSDLLMHYQVTELNDDKALAKNFEKVREEYRQHPEDGITCVRFGWMLHDCLRTASQRLHNVQLTEYFKKEFESWRFQGERKTRDLRLEALRLRDLDAAERFLSGPREALELFSVGSWEKARAAAKSYLESNPGDRQALDIAIKSCERIKTGDAAYDCFNLCVSACEWFPGESSFQQKLVYAAKECYWEIVELVKNADRLRTKMVVRDQYFQLFSELLDVFDGGRLDALPVGSVVYSHFLWVTTALTGEILKTADDERRAAVSRRYAAFVRSWGVKNFRPEDRCEYEGSRRRLSLAALVVLTLVSCCAAEEVSLDSEAWPMRFVLESASLFRRDPSRYCFALSDLYWRRGDVASAARYARELVMLNQTEAWRWRVLGRTFAEGTRERSDCLAKAASCGCARSDGPIMREWLAVLQSIVREEPADGLEQVRAEEDDKSALHRAEALLEEDANRANGVVQTWFEDKVTGTQVIRVWWKASHETNGRSDFVEFQCVDEKVERQPGAPIVVTYAEIAGRQKVFRIEPRDGVPWDVYPYVTVVVCERREGRHQARLMYAQGCFCLIDWKKVPAAADLKVGDICRVALFERKDLAPLVLDVRGGERLDRPAFCHVYTGTLARINNSRDARVGDVIVSPDVRGPNRFGEVVRGLAVDIGREALKAGAYRAITCQKISKDLEVLQ